MATSRGYLWEGGPAPDTDVDTDSDGDTDTENPYDSSKCGDGACGSAESSCNCPEDCGDRCGDSCCNGKETSCNCPEDCDSKCGDACCNGDEDTCTCSDDCGFKCGDGCCNGDEDTCTCAGDCGVQCGDGCCNGNETKDNCPKDCINCGDDVCDDSESPTSCEVDCPAVCPDDVCTEPVENAKNCPDDCDPVCPDGECTHGENISTCPDDCDARCGDSFCSIPGEDACACETDCDPVCGDKCCTGNEDVSNCAKDCFTAGYGYRKKITVFSSKVDENLTKFPLLVNLAGAPLLKTVANGGKVHSNKGYDIVFTDANRLPLAHEIEAYDPSTGALAAWVNIPSLSGSTDTVIYMYFGNGGVSASTEDSPGVWAERYHGVWHLTDLEDSTGKNSAAVATGTTGLASKIANGRDLNGTSDYLNAGNNGVLRPDKTLTLEAWIKAEQFGPDIHSNSIIGADHWPTGQYGYVLRCGELDAGKARLSFQVGTISGWQGVESTTTVLTQGQYHHVAGVLDARTDAPTLKLYVDGNLIATNTLGAATAIRYATAIDTELGRCPGDSVRFFNGVLDEARVSGNVHSDAWIKASFLNQNAPGSFYKIENTTL